MNIQVMTDYLQQYGAFAIFLIVFLEYLNLPGFPAGIIMPMAGIWASQGKIGFITAFLLSVLAGLCGSWVLYFLGRIGGEFLLKKYVKKFPKQKELIDRTMERLLKMGYLSVFVGKLIPMVRTIISIPAGVLKLNFIGYTIYSVLGIMVWNGVFVGLGFIFGESVLQVLL
ncbi:MAG: DedA family protein [Herbinix sp.]|jgi:membrane protein DedA with SNARE-associated domain|nr:DedA family protein [Herbinix sp.]